jgi:hypothetical protein
MVKAAVIEKAVEYIHYLEKMNTRLTNENAEMEARITASDKVRIQQELP